jgi:hypothetical protein
MPASIHRGDLGIRSDTRHTRRRVSPCDRTIEGLTTVDRRYIEAWVDDLDVRDLWERVQRE